MQKATFATDVGEYDYQSIMHYGPFTGAIDKSSPTIRPVDPSIPVSAVGTRGVVTPSDAQAVNFLYGNPPPPTIPGDWVLCATENGECDFSGTRTVAYGDGNSWNYQQEINGVNCNNSTFGAPIKGTVKACFYDN